VIITTGPQRVSEREEKLLEELLATIKAGIDITDDWTRQLGKVDIQRFLGSDISLTNPLLVSLVSGGAVIDAGIVSVLNTGVIVNPNFEQNLAGWQTKGNVTVETTPALVYSGAKSCRLAGTDDDVLSQDFVPTVRGSDVIEFSFYARRVDQPTSFAVHVYYDDGTTAGLTFIPSLASSFTKINPNFDSTKRLVRFDMYASPSPAVVDSFSFVVAPPVTVTSDATRQIGVATLGKPIWSRGIYNVVVNSDFEEGSLLGWTYTGGVSISTTYAYTGIYSCRLGTPSPFLIQDFDAPIRVDSLILKSIAARTDTGLANLNVRYYYTDGTYSENTFYNVGGWSTKTLSPTAGKYIRRIQISCSGLTGGATAMFVDNLCLTTFAPIDLLSIGGLLQTPDDWTVELQSINSSLSNIWLKLDSIDTYLYYLTRQSDGYETTTPLTANSEYVGGAHYAEYYSVLSVFAAADVVGTLYIEQTDSTFSIGFILSEAFPIVGGIPFAITTRLKNVYYRFRFVNGPTDQAYFNISYVESNVR